MQVELRYGYRISNAEADQAYNDFVQFDGIIKDASYESNIYGCNLKFRKFYSNTTLNLGYRLETRFYDSDFADDNYHIQRDDYMHTASVSIYKALDRNISLLIDAELGFRQTDSPYDYVIDDKEFSYWKSGISLSYDFDLK
jgi:hypothetical protein